MNTVNDLIDFVSEECDKNGWHYLIQIDDGESIKGRWKAVTDSKLHNMAGAVNRLADSVKEVTYK